MFVCTSVASGRDDLMFAVKRLPASLHTLETSHALLGACMRLSTLQDARRLLEIVSTRTGLDGMVSVGAHLWAVVCPEYQALRVFCFCCIGRGLATFCSQ